MLRRVFGFCIRSFCELNLFDRWTDSLQTVRNSLLNDDVWSNRVEQDFVLIMLDTTLKHYIDLLADDCCWQIKVKWRATSDACWEFHEADETVAIKLIYFTFCGCNRWMNSVPEFSYIFLLTLNFSRFFTERVFLNPVLCIFVTLLLSTIICRNTDRLWCQ